MSTTPVRKLMEMSKEEFCEVVKRAEQVKKDLMNLQSCNFTVAEMFRLVNAEPYSYNGIVIIQDLAAKLASTS